MTKLMVVFPIPMEFCDSNQHGLERMVRSNFEMQATTIRSTTAACFLRLSSSSPWLRADVFIALKRFESSHFLV